MTRLSRESRDFIRMSRSLDRISAQDKARIHEKLSRRLGMAAALGTTLSAVSAAEAARSTTLIALASWIPGTAKVVGVFVMVSASTFGIASTFRHVPRTATSAAASSPTERRPLRGSPSHPIPTAETFAREHIGEVAAATEASASASPSRPSAIRNKEAPATRRPVPATPDRDETATRPITAGAADFGKATSRINEAPTARVSPISDELFEQAEALRSSRAAMRRGDPRAALDALDSTFPSSSGGPLEQEALYTRVTALCLQGETMRARAVAERFLASYPGSLLVARIRSSCAYRSVEPQ